MQSAMFGLQDGRAAILSVGLHLACPRLQLDELPLRLKVLGLLQLGLLQPDTR